MKKILLALVGIMFSLSAWAQNANELFQQGENAESTNDFAGAVSAYLQAKDAFMKEGRGETAEAAQCLHNLARAYANQNMLKESRKYNLEALELRKKLFGEVSEPYITTHNNYALTYSIEENFPKAIELQTRTVQLMEKLPKPHSQAAMFYYNLGRYYFLSDDYQNAAIWWEKALAGAEKFGELYERCLEGLGMIYSELNSMNDVYRIMALMDEHNTEQLKKPCDEPQCMLERAQYYGVIGDNANARDCYNKLFGMQMSEELKVKAYEQYAQFLASNNNDFAGAAENFQTAAKAQEKFAGIDEEYASLMFSAAQYFFISKEYKKSINCYEDVIDFYDKLSGDAAISNIILCRDGIANAYNGLKDFEAAIPIRKEVLEHYTNVSPDKEKQAKSVVKLADSEKFAGHYDDAIEHYKEGLALYEELDKPEEYTNTVSSLNLCYIYAGKKDRAESKEEEKKKILDERMTSLIEEEKSHLHLTKDFFGPLIYARSVGVIAGCYAMMEDYPNATAYYKQYISDIRDAVRDEFRLKGENDRMLIWNDQTESMHRILEMLVSIPEGYDSEMSDLAGIAYDVELLSKGILLNSSIEFEKVLRDTDKQLADIYKKVKENDKKLAELRKLEPNEKNVGMIQQLQRVNDDLQLKLYQGCAEFADFTNYISFSWKDVQNKLPEDGVAIEFVSINTSPFDAENFIVALVISKDMKSPVALPIVTVAMAKIMESDSELFKTPLVGDLVWGSALKPYIEGKKKIYFSPDGQFNHLAIEYLMWDGKPLFDQFEVYRLSSTKELCYDKPKRQLEYAALIGNVDYNNFGLNKDDAKVKVSVLRGGSDEDSFDALNNTEFEILEIEKILTQNNVEKIVKLELNDASESAFRELSDSKTNLLHIATHGKYRNNKKASDTESMQDSFLVFAGANLSALDDDTLNDGIITATDVAQMNLRDCDLVVLSACDTGLGKLSEDGVYGLQRGFKNAGVNTLLMSLKNVNDESTAKLMVAFYKNLLDGKSKREALKIAINDLRKNGYDDPNHWASFILLDAF